MLISNTVVQITPIGIQNLHWKFYILWLLFNALIVPTVYVFYPETADRSLEDMDRFFRSHDSIFMYKYKEATSVRRPPEYGDGDTAEGIVIVPKSYKGQTASGCDAEKEEIFEERVE